MLLRKCRQCGLEAHNESELALFIPQKGYKHGRGNLCNKCQNINYRPGGKWRESAVRSYRKWDAIKNPRRIRFLGRRIDFPQNPRTNICSHCHRRYPSELKRQTTMHHVFYNSDNPLEGTIELCTSCHNKIHGAIRKLLR